MKVIYTDFQTVLKEKKKKENQNVIRKDSLMNKAWIYKRM